MMIGAPQYQLVRKLDDGVLSEVFLATEDGAHEHVVLTLFRSGALQDEQAAASIFEQAKLWQELQHPNLARQLKAGHAPDGRLYVVSESIEGEDLGSHLRTRGALQPEQLVQLVIPACAGLGYLHERGLVHGDLRPVNILLPGGLGAFKPRLINFGLQGMRRPGRDANGTAPSFALEYVAPECAEGKEPDARSDVYSLGAVMYEALTGSAPLAGSSIAKILEKHLRSAPPPINGPGAYLNPIIGRCLCRAPQDRFSNASELAAALRETRPGGTLSFAPRIRDREPVPEQPREKEGDVLGSYELVELIGEGSMGRVFLARHARLGRQVALKVLRPEHLRNRNLIQRFFQEARSVNQINHEHIVEVFDFVDEVDAAGSGRVYCVMELLVGSSLSQLQKREPVGIARGVQIAQQVCAALDAAHQLGVVHRDVKPDNIFITEKNGEKNYVKVLDFGVAKLTSPLGEEKSSGTLEGAIVGTPAYMSPEQAAGLGADYRADIYGVGVVLYEMMGGRPPFESPAFGQLVVQIITKPPPGLPSTTPAGERIPSELKSLVMSCLEKDPARRPQSMRELSDALAVFAAGGGQRRPPVRTYAALAAGALVIAALGTGVLLRSPLAARKLSTPPMASPSAPVGANSLPSSARLALDPARGGSGSLSSEESAGQTRPIDQLRAAEKSPVSSAPARAPSRRPKRKMGRDSIIDPFAN